MTGHRAKLFFVLYTSLAPQAFDLATVMLLPYARTVSRDGMGWNKT